MTSRLNHSAVVLSLAHRYPAHVDLVAEYVNESEHQDGRGCWASNFKTLADVFADFALYAKDARPLTPILRGDVTPEEAKEVIAADLIKTAEMQFDAEEKASATNESINELVWDMLEDIQSEISEQAWFQLTGEEGGV